MSDKVLALTEKRMMMDSELKQYNSGESFDDDKVNSDYILYVDDSTLSSEAMEERKKKFDFCLQCSLIFKKDLQETPTWLTSFPFLVSKKEKLAFSNATCIDKIKTLKVLKQYKKKIY